MSIHESEKYKYERKGKKVIWAWLNTRVVDRAFESIWQLTGEWQARRGARLSSKHIMRRIIIEEIISLAEMLNGNNINSLRSLNRFSIAKRRDVIFRISRSMLRISLLKKTKIPQPMLGSKILHHFFPTIVPVFDDVYISKRVLKVPQIHKFISSEDTFFFSEKKHARIVEYQGYHRFCSSQICQLPEEDLKRIRAKYGEMVADMFPHRMYQNKKSNLWKLDAKIAEYCLVGATY